MIKTEFVIQFIGLWEYSYTHSFGMNYMHDVSFSNVVLAKASGWLRASSVVH